MKKKTVVIIASSLALVLVAALAMVIGANRVKVGNFYVKYAAEGDGLSPENPAGSVNAVKKAINKELGKGDIANVWIIEDESKSNNIYAFGKTEGNKRTNSMAVWKKSDEKSIDHKADLVVQSYSPKGKKSEDIKTAHLAFSEIVAENSILTLTGPTEFKNIKLVPTATTDMIDMSGYSAVFGNDLVYRSIALEDGGDYSNWQEIELLPEASDFKTCLCGKQNAVIEDGVSLTFDNRPYNSGVFYLPDDKSASVEFKKDFTVNYNDQNSAAFKMVIGAAEGKKSDYSAHFRQNLNIKMKKADAVNISSGKASVMVDGALQLIVDAKTTYYTSEDKQYSFKSLTNVKTKNDNGKLTQADTIILYVDSSKQDYIDFIDGKAGEFKIEKGYVAVAEGINKDITVTSKNGKLVLDDLGEYNISIGKDYINNGESVVVYKKCEIDIASLWHQDVEGYAFIGWKLEDGTVPKADQSFKKGTKLFAHYTPIDFTIENTEIKEGAGGEHDLLFVINKGNSFYEKLPKPLEYGAIYLPVDDTLGGDIYINEPVVQSWKWDLETGLDFEPALIGRRPIRVKSWNESVKNPQIYEKNEYNVKYALRIEDIGPDNYYTWYYAKGYIIYEDLNGCQRIVYTSQQPQSFDGSPTNYDKDQSCLYKIAKETPQDKRTNTQNQIIEYVEGEGRQYYQSYITITEYLDKTPEKLLYKLANGIIVRDVTVSTGLNTEKTEICFITDPHFAAIDKKDIKENATNALSSYRGRRWTNNTNFRSASYKYMEYAGMFEKTVIGGDAVDYLTNGSIGAVSRLLTKKSIAGSIKMVLGNHESSEISQNDIKGLHNIRTIEQRYSILKANWTNDPEYSSEILNKTDGSENLMLIYLDNAGKKEYNSTQLEKFKADIKLARQKNIPIILFQHIPMSQKVTQKTEVDTDGEISKQMDIEIRQNADIIKAVFAGHIHEITSGYIEGLGQDGLTNGLKIPQYTGAGGHYNNVMKITVE